ncbi:MAG: tyrosine protein phosphatase [Limnochordia bacterium]|nr:tyrosine protein phosphatase [Limnochordia bacterium]
MAVVDIHTHVLPGLDDGADSMEEAVAMLRTAEEAGIASAIATPHFLMKDEWESYIHAAQLSFAELTKQAAGNGLGISLHLGFEVEFDSGLLNINDVTPLTLAGTGVYLLLELPLNQIPPCVEEVLFRVLVKGVIPIIAHPERNAVVYHQPEFLHWLVEQGALLQVNAGSLLGVFGTRVREVAWSLLEAKMVHVIASDMHRKSGHRGVCYGQVKQELQGRIEPHYLKALLEDNPSAVLAGREVKVEDPLPLPRFGVKPPWWQRILGRLKGSNEI